MKTIELFAGTGSFSKVAKARGHSIFRVEINPEFENELTKDILDVTTKELPNIDSSKNRNIYILQYIPIYP